MSPHPLPQHVRERVVARQARLRSLGFADYAEYLASSEWGAKRKQYKASGRIWACICGDDGDGLELHHLTYERVGGDELLDDLEPLCGSCHALVHALERRGLIRLDLTGLELDKERARIQRARVHAAEARRTAQRQEFHALPLHERLELLQRAQRDHSGPLHKDLAFIELLIRKAEQKVAGRVTGVDALTARRQARLSDQLHALELKLTQEKPQALDDLAGASEYHPVIPRSNIGEHRCEGYECSHPLCRAEVEHRVKHLTRRPKRTSQPWEPRAAKRAA